MGVVMFYHLTRSAPAETLAALLPRASDPDLLGVFRPVGQDLVALDGFRPGAKRIGPPLAGTLQTAYIVPDRGNLARAQWLRA